MKNRLFYEVKFKATRTCQNGNEKTEIKTVFVPRFDDHNKHVTPEIQIATARMILTENHFYNLEYIETKNSNIMIASDNIVNVATAWEIVNRKG